MVAMVACEWIFRVHYPKPGGEEEHAMWMEWLTEHGVWPSVEELADESYEMLLPSNWKRKRYKVSGRTTRRPVPTPKLSKRATPSCCCCCCDLHARPAHASQSRRHWQESTLTAPMVRPSIEILFRQSTIHTTFVNEPHARVAVFRAPRCDSHHLRQ